jgi:hypothetical protein
MGHDAKLKRPMGNLAMHDFARLVAEGALPPRDRMNNAIGRGHLVLYHPAVDVIYQVMDVVPVMDPRQPGTVRLHLMAEVPLTVPINRPIAELLVCGITAATEMAKGPGAADGNSDGEPAADSAASSAPTADPAQPAALESSETETPPDDDPDK